MRVLTYTSLFPNKMDPEHGIFIYQRMMHFASRPGNSVTVVAPVAYVPRWLKSSKYQRFNNIPDKENIGNLTVYHPRYVILPKVSMLLHGWSMFLGSYQLVNHLHAAHQFECIDAHYVYPDGFAAVLLGKALGIPVIVSARGTDINLFPSFPLIRPMIKWTLANVTAGIGVSNPLLQSMRKLGLPSARSYVIGNGVDRQRFNAVDSLSARARLNLPRDNPIIVAVGGLVPSKGFGLLISAIAEVRKKYPDVLLYIIGKGPERPNLERLIAERQLEGSTFLVGRQPNERLKDWYSAAQVTCLASSREGCANVLLESMACGTPVVATKIGGTPDVIASPQLGVLVEQNVNSLANGIETALATSWDRIAIAEFAQQRTWDQVAAEVDKTLSESTQALQKSASAISQK